VALHREKVELARGLSLELVIDRGKAGAYRYCMSGHFIIMKIVMLLELKFVNCFRCEASNSVGTAVGRFHIAVFCKFIQ
jgi:hypothetical protein